jgi:hypothetical protein
LDAFPVTQLNAILTGSKSKQKKKKNLSNFHENKFSKCKEIEIWGQGAK